MRLSRQTHDGKAWPLVVGLLALLFWLGCAHAVIAVAPEPCEPFTAEAEAELAEMIEFGDYPGILRVLSEYDQHCCEDDAMVKGRDVSHCEVEE